MTSRLERPDLDEFGERHRLTPRKGVRRVLRAGEKSGGLRGFRQRRPRGVHLRPEPRDRLKIVKKFDGLSIGARFDFPSGDCRIKEASAQRHAWGGSRFWRWFKKVEVQPEVGDVEVFTRPPSGACPRCRASEGSRTQQKYELQVQDYFQAVGEHARHAAAASGRVGAIAAARFDGTST